MTHTTSLKLKGCPHCSPTPVDNKVCIKCGYDFKDCGAYGCTELKTSEDSGKDIPEPKYITEYKDRIFPKDLDLDPDSKEDNQWEERLRKGDLWLDAENMEEIVDFIRQELSKARTEVTEEVLGMINYMFDREHTYGEATDALEELRTKLKEGIK
jgi:hypothetical protein